MRRPMNPFSKYLLLTALIFPSSTLWAGDAGTTAADFLNLGIGPRAIAMGDAQTGLADDVYATYWNPAGLSQLKTQEVAFTHTNYVQGINQEYLAYAYPNTRFGSFGIHLNY